MILFCLPYAGGSESIYYNWKEHINSSIILEAIELKGRGKRFSEDLYKDFEEAVDDILLNIKNKIMHHEYAIWGHSLGSLFAFELYYKICKENIKKPKHIFFSGSAAPSIMRKQKKIHMLPDDDFINEIVKLGGTPKEVLENKELLQLVIPILRNDMRISESYNYKEKSNKIACDITVFRGKDDDITLEELLAWKNHCSGDFKAHTLDGNHFFINNNIESIASIINSTLKN